MNDHYKAVWTTSPEGGMHLAKQMRRSDSAETVCAVLVSDKNTGDVLVTMQLCIRTDVRFDSDHLARHVAMVRDWAADPELADRLEGIFRRAGTWTGGDEQSDR